MLGKHFIKSAFALSLALLLLFTSTGCASRAALLNRETKNETEAIEEMESLLIQAIETEDRELLKSAFSEKALYLAGDIDTGIDYIFYLFEGDIISIDERNHSSLDHTEAAGKTHKIDAVCRITTTSATYWLSYIFYSIQELDPAAKGVYVLRLETDEAFKESDGYLFRIAGIDYPERMIIHETAEQIASYLNAKDHDGLKSLFSQRALSECNDFDIGADQLWDSFTEFKIIGLQDSWMDTEELDGAARHHVYLDLRISKKGRYLLYFCYDASQDGNRNGIYRMKLSKSK